MRESELGGSRPSAATVAYEGAANASGREGCSQRSSRTTLEGIEIGLHRHHGQTDDTAVDALRPGPHPPWKHLLRRRGWASDPLGSDADPNAQRPNGAHRYASGQLGQSPLAMELGQKSPSMSIGGWFGVAGRHRCRRLTTKKGPLTRSATANTVCAVLQGVTGAGVHLGNSGQ